MYIGVDIGGSKILVAASRDGQTILHQAKIKTPPEAAQGIIEIIHLIEQVADGHPLKAIAVAAAAVDLARGAISVVSPNMHGWRGTNLLEPLRNHFKVPTKLHNDVAAAAITEATSGAGSLYPDVLYVTISTGVGAALVIAGEVYTGARGVEAGHMIINPDGPLCGCGGHGHLEAYISGPAIKRRFGKYGYEITDPKIWDAIARDMAIGFHNLILTYSPSVVVIGGGVGVHYDQFYDALMKHIEELVPMFTTPPIVPAKYIETAVIQGALLLATRLKA